MQTDFPPLISFPQFLHVSPSLLTTLFFPVLVVILVGFFILYAIVTSVLVYHWRTYGMKNGVILIAQTLFFFVSGALFFTASLALYYY